MVNMLKEESNAYMRPLNALREFIKNTHYDPKKRNWIARSLQEDGSVKLSPNAYSPQHCEELLKIVLTIDANERDEAYALGIAPRFEMLSLSNTLCIEILWGRYGYHDAAAALKIWDDIVNKGVRYDIPDNTHIAKKSEFTAAVKKYSKTPTVPFTDREFDSMFSGFRDLYAAQADCEDIIIKNGKQYSNAQTDFEFTVSQEGLEMFEYFEWDNFMEKYSESSFNPTAVVHYFVGLGTIQLSKGNHSQMDRMLRMANQIHRLGIRDILNNPDELIRRLLPDQAEPETKPPAVFKAVKTSESILNEILLGGELLSAAPQPTNMNVKRDQIELF